MVDLRKLLPFQDPAEISSATVQMHLSPSFITEYRKLLLCHVVSQNNNIALQSFGQCNQFMLASPHICPFHSPAVVLPIRAM
jgi:hypothetical protein